MKIYRVEVPAAVMISVPAESEDHAKRIAAAAVYTPTFALQGLDNEAFRHSAIGVRVYISDEIQQNPSAHCEVVDLSEVITPPMGYTFRWLKPLQDFAELNNNAAELGAAIDKR